MIRLPNAGTYSLELVTAQNGAQVVVCYSDATSSTYIGGTQATAIVSATTTAICATPAASTVRDVDQINIKNTFAGSHTITVQLDVAATNVPIITATLLTDESLNYTHGSGWQQKDANGNTKTNPIGFVMTSAQLAAIVSDETGTGALVFANSPTLVTPALGTPSAAVLTNATGLPATSVINTPAGNIAATTVQAALNELDSEKAKVGALASSGITGAAASGANADITSMTAVTSISATGGTAVKGTNTNDNAAAGMVGEYIESVVDEASAISLTTINVVNVTSISLTPGDWDVSACVQFLCGATTNITELRGSISLTSNTQDLTRGRLFEVKTAPHVPVSVRHGIAGPTLRFSLASTTTIYLIAQGVFTVSTLSVYGIISARRAR